MTGLILYTFGNVRLFVFSLSEQLDIRRSHTVICLSCVVHPTAKKMSSQRRKAFMIEEKGAILCRLENGESNSSLAKEFGVGHSTISMIFKNKNCIKESFNSNVLKPKRLRKSRQENVDQALIQQFKIMRNTFT